MSSARRGHDVSKHSRSFRCQCSRHVLFRNNLCIACSTLLGHLPLTPGSAPGRWRVAEKEREYKRCVNLDTPAGCSWLLPADAAASHCISCRLDRTIPDLGDADNRLYWSAIEAAKRRLVSQLLSLGLPVKSKLSEDTERGVMFDFLRPQPDGPRAMTGQTSGLIKLNVKRQTIPSARRSAMTCASRTARCSATFAMRSVTTTGTAWSGTSAGSSVSAGCSATSAPTTPLR